MPHRALTISSAHHATALTLYVVMALLGLFHVLGVANHEWVTAEFGEAGSALWATLYLIGPLTAFASAWIAPKIRVPVLPLWGEAAGCILTAVTNIAFGYCMWAALGFKGAATSQTLLLGLGAGMVLRFVQIVKDQGRMKRAIESRQYADPPPLAEADNPRG